MSGIKARDFASLQLQEIKEKDLKRHGIDASLTAFKQAANAGIIQPTKWEAVPLYSLAQISETIDEGGLDILTELREFTLGTGTTKPRIYAEVQEFYDPPVPRPSMGKTRRGGF